MGRRWAGKGVEAASCSSMVAVGALVDLVELEEYYVVQCERKDAKTRFRTDETPLSFTPLAPSLPMLKTPKQTTSKTPQRILPARKAAEPKEKPQEAKKSGQAGKGTSALSGPVEHADEGLECTGKAKKPRTSTGKAKEEVSADVFSTLPLDILLEVRRLLPTSLLELLQRLVVPLL